MEPRRIQKKTIMLLFTALVLMNWSYIACIQYTSDSISNSWIIMLPMLAYFYFAFAVVACIELYRETKLGLALALTILFFGIISAVLTSTLVPNNNPLYNLIIILLITINFLVIFYIGYHKMKFKSN